MNNLAVINNVSVEFEVIGESVFADTLKIAEVFEKRHDNILRLIEDLPDDEFKTENFKESFYLNKQNKRQPCYNLTRDGFSLLVMGFTGEKAYRWKIEFIKAFNIMERQIYDQKLSLAKKEIVFIGKHDPSLMRKRQTLKSFIESAVLADSGSFVPSPYLYAVYRQYASLFKERPFNLMSFYKYFKAEFARLGIPIVKAQKRMPRGAYIGFDGSKPYCVFGIRLSTLKLGFNEIIVNGQRLSIESMNFIAPPNTFAYGNNLISVSPNINAAASTKQEALIRQNERLLIENKKLKRVVSKLKAKNDEE